MARALKSAALALIASLIASAAEHRSYDRYSFETYLGEWDKSYKGEELNLRQALFDTSLDYVMSHNAEYEAGEHTWYMAMNHLADWTQEELAALRSTKFAPSEHPIVQLSTNGGNPDSMDWRTKNAVTPVKNQGSCGSCWAFSATESVESHYAIASGKLIELAPQTYVNCVQNPDGCGGTGGCDGATMELAFNLTAQKGIAAEADLPYQGSDEQCSAYKPAVKVDGYVKLPVNDAMALETALATTGPVSVNVAAGLGWHFYGGGIFDGCSHWIFSTSTLDHAVQAVGYTKDSWIVRNSWGSSWGEKGFIRISRANDGKTFTDKNPSSGVACKPFPETQQVGGECGILFDSSYPIGAKAAAEEAIIV